jgi:hypothetical protein
VVEGEVVVVVLAGDDLAVVVVDVDDAVACP